MAKRKTKCPALGEEFRYPTPPSTKELIARHRITVRTPEGEFHAAPGEGMPSYIQVGRLVVGRKFRPQRPARRKRA